MISKMPKRRLFCVRSPRTSGTAVSALCTALDILKEVAPLVPIPGLNTAIDVASAILMRVKNVQILDLNLNVLAQSTGCLMVAILGELHETPMADESVDLLLRTLRNANDFVQEQCERKWWSRLFHHVDLEEQLRGHLEQLDACSKAFQITSLMRVRKLLETAQARQGAADELLLEIKKLLEKQTVMIQTQTESVSLSQNNVSTALSILRLERHEDRRINSIRHDEVIQAISTVSPLRQRLDDGEGLIFRKYEIEPTEVFISQDAENGPVYFARLRDGGLPVIWKLYGTGQAARQRFSLDLDHWYNMCHPNILQLLGHSSPFSEDPFIVVTGVTTARNVLAYVRRATVDPDPRVGFMTALSVLQGVSAALDYLRSNRNIGKYELQDCVEVSNILLNPEGRVILGKNIMRHIPGPGVHDTLRLEQWILKQFGSITEKVLFGTNYDFTDWKVIFGKNGSTHIRALQRLSAWYADQGFTSVTGTINDLAVRLTDREAIYGRLNWIRIREAFLETEGIKHNMFYRPSEAWDVTLYDVGLVQDGRFIRLCNVSNEVDFELEYQRPLYFSTFPELSPEETLLSNGMTRYTFPGPLYIAIGKTSSGKHVKNSAEAFRFMIDRSPSLVAQHRNQHRSLNVSDLVFIIGTNELPKSAGFEWYPIDEHDLGPQFTVYFYAKPDPRNDEFWGFWSLNPIAETEEKISHPQIRSFVNKTPPQTIMFVQLENEDCAPITEE